MQLTEIQYGAAAPIDGYGPGFFRVGGTIYDGAILCLPDRIAPWAGLADQGPLLALAGEIDVLLVGMGAEIAFLPTAAREALESAGIGVEVMSSPSAARTYNVLLSEGRRVGAALLPV